MWHLGQLLLLLAHGNQLGDEGDIDGFRIKDYRPKIDDELEIWLYEALKKMLQKDFCARAALGLVKGLDFVKTEHQVHLGY